MILGLGTAQLGLPYGVNNSVGGLTDDQALDLLEAARLEGWEALDVSHHYRDAQRRVDKYMAVHPGAFLVMRRGMAYYESVYTWQEAVASKASLIQLPANCLDGRNDEVIPELQRHGRRVVVRSLLLQGLLAVLPYQLLPKGTVGSALWFQSASVWLAGLNVIASTYDMSVVELAVRWSWTLMPDVALFGAETPEQIYDITKHWKKGRLHSTIENAVYVLRKDIPEIVISPRMWGQDYGFSA